MKPIRHALRDKRTIWILLTVFACALAAAVYFTNLLYQPCFVDDEFISARTAKNFAAGMGFYEKETLRYTRAWPATLLLAGWIRLQLRGEDAP